MLLIEETEGFLENKHLRLVKMEDDILFEAEIRGAMNSVELSVDVMYMDINFRACELARQNIITSQALLRANLGLIRDRKGRALIPHVQGEAVMLYRCQPTMVRVRHDVRKCCQELPIWYGKNFSIPAFLQPISKKISSVCIPRICNKFDTPIFSIGSTKFPKWIRIEKDGEIKRTENPQEFIPQSHNKEHQRSWG